MQLYLNASPEGAKGKAKAGKLRPEEAKLPGEREMGLKQFTNISELLSKLKMDLHLSYHSFLKEFISEPNDGVTLLLDLLKVFIITIGVIVQESSSRTLRILQSHGHNWQRANIVSLKTV